MLSFDQILLATGNRLGRHDVPCPVCGPERRTKANQRRTVLRVWLKDDFATFACARCGLRGHTRDANAGRPDPAFTARARAEAERRDAADAAERHRIAIGLWGRSLPADGTPVPTYLLARGIEVDPVPATLRFLPATPPKYSHPAMVAAFGIPVEPEPGALRMPRAAMMGVHLTLLSRDGGGKAGTGRDKIMVGRSTGWPIVVAPPNDGHGLAVAEGIESALSIHAATGLGAWAAGAAGRMPGLADHVPAYIDCVTVFVEDDPTGQKGAMELAERLAARGIEVILVEGHDGL